MLKINQRRTLGRNEFRLTLEDPGSHPVASMDSFTGTVVATLEKFAEIEASVTGKPAEIKWTISGVGEVDDAE